MRYHENMAWIPVLRQKNAARGEPRIRWNGKSTYAQLTVELRRWIEAKCPNPYEPHVLILEDPSRPGVYGLQPCDPSTKGSLKLSDQNGGISASFWRHIVDSADVPVSLDDKRGIAVFKVNLDEVPSPDGQDSPALNHHSELDPMASPSPQLGDAAVSRQVGVQTASPPNTPATKKLREKHV